MNFIKKIKLNSVIDEKAEMLESYRTKIENFNKENRISHTWVYHLADNELKSLGLNKPWECQYYHVTGNPNPEPSLWDIQKKTLSDDRRLIGESREIFEERQRIHNVAKSWAKTIGAREVLIYKTNTSSQYIKMINDFAHEIMAFIELNKSVHGKLREPKWEWLIKFAQEKINELQQASYVIERPN